MIPTLPIRELKCCVAVKRKWSKETDAVNAKRQALEEGEKITYTTAEKDGAKNVSLMKNGSSIDVKFDDIPMVMAQLSDAYVRGGGSRGTFKVVRKVLRAIENHPIWSTPEEEDDDEITVGPTVAQRAALPRVTRHGSEYVAEYLDIPRTLRCQFRIAQDEDDPDEDVLEGLSCEETDEYSTDSDVDDFL